MEIRQLKHFLAVAKYKNFTLAAKNLHIAQPALSISIKKFESQLGISLFKRDERSVELTHEGNVLAEHAQRILRQVDDAQLALDELKGLVKGEVRLGTPGMMGSYFFPQIVMAFKSRFPNLKIVVIEAGSQSIRKMLLNGELDIGVIQNRNVPEQLEVDHLIQSQMVAAVGKQHTLADSKSITFREFFNHDLVMFQKGYFHREFIDSICQKENFTPKIAFETNLLPMILNIVRQEYAITPLLELVTEKETDLVAIPFDPPITLDLVLAWRKEGYLSNADRTFIEFIKHYV